MIGRASAWVMAAVVAAAPACKAKPADQGASAPVAGLGAVPADAQIVMAFDVGRLADSQLVMRGVDLVLQRDPTIAAEWTKLATACNVDVRTQIRQIILALGPTPVAVQGAPAPAVPPPQPVLMVLTGSLTEASLSTCVKTALGTGGGDVSARIAGSRTIYTATEGKRTVFFSFGQADTVVLSSSAAWLEQALGNGPKLDRGALAPLVARANREAPAWATGRPNPAISGGLVRATGGALKAGPSAIFVSFDPTRGFDAALGADLATEDDAKVLEQFAKQQLQLLALVAQARGLGPLVAKLGVTRTTTHLKFAISLSAAEVNQLLQAIDRPPEDPQDSPPSVDANPATDAGSAK